MLGIYGGLLWAFWEYVLHEKSIPGLGFFDLFTFRSFSSAFHWPSSATTPGCDTR